MTTIFMVYLPCRSRRLSASFSSSSAAKDQLSGRRETARSAIAPSGQTSDDPSGLQRKWQAASVDLESTSVSLPANLPRHGHSKYAIIGTIPLKRLSTPDDVLLCHSIALLAPAF
jgi:hypothetical protein